MITIAGLGLSVFAILLLALFALLFSSYVKIVTVLSIVRAGFGVHSLPSAFVTAGLALALSFFVMYPTLQESLRSMDSVIRSGGASTDVRRARAIEAALPAWKDFLARNTDAEDLARFSEVAVKLDQANQVEVAETAVTSWRILAPAFLVSELKEAFITGLNLFLPFLVIDLCIASALVAVGVTRINPVLIALPFKLLLFVMVDGWTVITSNLVATYGVG